MPATSDNSRNAPRAQSSPAATYIYQGATILAALLIVLSAAI
jgi:hypothetical protein